MREPIVFVSDPIFHNLSRISLFFVVGAVFFGAGDVLFFPLANSSNTSTKRTAGYSFPCV